MSMKRKHYVYKENYQKWNHLRITLCFLSVVYLVGEMMFFFYICLLLNIEFVSRIESSH